MCLRAYICRSMDSAVLLNACYQLIHQTVDSLTRTAACCSCCLVRPRARRHGLLASRYATGRSWPPCLQARVPAATTLSLPGLTTTCLRSRRVLQVRVPCMYAAGKVIELAVGRVSPMNRTVAPVACAGKIRLAVGRVGPGGVAGAVRAVRIGRDRAMRRSIDRESNAVMAPCRRPGTCRRHARPPRDHGACVRASMQRRAPPADSIRWMARSRRPCGNDVVPGQGGVRAGRQRGQLAMGHAWPRPTTRTRSVGAVVQRVGVSARRRGKKRTHLLLGVTVPCAAGLHARKGPPAGRLAT